MDIILQIDIYWIITFFCIGFTIRNVFSIMKSRKTMKEAELSMENYNKHQTLHQMGLRETAEILYYPKIYPIEHFDFYLNGK